MFAAADSLYLGKQASIPVGENNKGERAMNVTTKKMTALKRAVVLTAVLVLTGTASAKKAANAPGVSGDLSDDRTSATVSVSQQCAPPSDPLAPATSGTVSVYILQSVGRLINIGIGNGSVPCDGVTVTQDITVNAIPGLTFQPGPATMLIRFTTIDPADPTKTIVSESGARINLHP